MPDRLNEEMRKEFAPAMKIGLVATIDAEGAPHLTVLSTLMGKGERTMLFGKFVEGLSKDHVLARPKAGFLIMTPAKAFWYGRMDFRATAAEGEDYVYYNDQPLYRYNAYFGINTVYYFDLKDISDRQKLPMGEVIVNALRILFRKRRLVRRDVAPRMKPWAERFTAKLDTLTFLSFLDADGYPVVVPVIAGQSAGPSRFVLNDAMDRDRLAALAAGSPVAVLAFSMTMETVLLKGTFSGFDPAGYGWVDVERVYNSMPPVHGYVYPPEPVKTVVLPE